MEINESPPLDASERMALRLGVLIILLLMLGTIQRNYVWASAKTLWQDVVTKAPENPVGYLNLAEDFVRSGNYEAAFRNYQAAMKFASMDSSIRGRDLLAHAQANMGIMLLQMPHATAGDLRVAESALRGSLSLMPNNGAAALGLASLLNGQGRYYDALLQIDAAERAESSTAVIQADMLHFEKGVALCGLHQVRSANSQLTKAASMGFGIKLGFCGPEGTIHGSKS